MGRRHIDLSKRHQRLRYTIFMYYSFSINRHFSHLKTLFLTPSCFTVYAAPLGRRMLGLNPQEVQNSKFLNQCFFVTEIHCMSTESVTTFTAVLRLPEGHTARPVLDGLPRLPAPSACLIQAGPYDEELAGRYGEELAGRHGEELAGRYSLQLSQLAPCGVRECEEQGEAWLCLLVRFPILAGRKLNVALLAGCATARSRRSF